MQTGISPGAWACCSVHAASLHCPASQPGQTATLLPSCTYLQRPSARLSHLPVLQAKDTYQTGADQAPCTVHNVAKRLAAHATVITTYRRTGSRWLAPQAWLISGPLQTASSGLQ